MTSRYISQCHWHLGKASFLLTNGGWIMDKQLTATEKFSWLLISLLPELSIIIYLKLKMQDEILSNVITGLIIFAVITIFNILIYIVLKIALMIYSYLKLKKIKEETPDEVKQKDVRNIFMLKVLLMNIVLLFLLIISIRYLNINALL